MASDRMNFTAVCALIIDSDSHATRIFAQILRGFGLSLQTIVETAVEEDAEQF